MGLGEREGLGRGRKRAGKIEGLRCPWAIFEYTLKKEHTAPPSPLGGNILKNNCEK